MQQHRSTPPLCLGEVGGGARAPGLPEKPASGWAKGDGWAGKQMTDILKGKDRREDLRRRLACHVSGGLEGGRKAVTMMDELMHDGASERMGGKSAKKTERRSDRSICWLVWQ